MMKYYLVWNVRFTRLCPWFAQQQIIEHAKAVNAVVVGLKEFVDQQQISQHIPNIEHFGGLFLFPLKINKNILTKYMPVT